MTDKERLDCMHTQEELNKMLVCKICSERPACTGLSMKLISERLRKLEEKESI